MTKSHSWKSWWNDWLASWRTPVTDSATDRSDRATDKPALSPQKQQRQARRETLYGVIREGMIRAGVLSSAYKFKVLSLDNEGLSYLVLIDIRAEALQDMAGSQTSLENGLRFLAQERARLLVKSVYWRLMPSIEPTTSSPQHGRAGAHEEITHDEIAALHQALAGRKAAPSRAETPDFAPTEIMVRRPTPSDHPLSATQMGELG